MSSLTDRSLGEDVGGRRREPHVLGPREACEHALEDARQDPREYRISKPRRKPTDRRPQRVRRVRRCHQLPIHAARQDHLPRAGGEHHLGGRAFPCQLDRELTRGVAETHDEHAAASPVHGLGRIEIVLGMEPVSRERTRQLGPARIPEVAGGRHQGVEAAAVSGFRLHLPALCFERTSARHPRAEADAIEHAEVLRIALEPRRHLLVAREVGQRLGQLEVREPTHALVGVGAQRAVGGRGAARVAEHPLAAHAVARFERHRVEAEPREHLEGREATRSAPDDGHPLQ